jgi:hypothetical protein
MLKYINSILCQFRSCFSREATFQWFVVILLGLMQRSDHLGLTSIIRDLSLPAHYYESLIHFFRSSAWSLESLRRMWLQVVRRVAPLYSLNGAVILIGDGMKQAKEARRMPGVKKLHQESENSSKAEYIFGHMFGAIGILMGTTLKWFCLPLFMNLQGGVKSVFGWNHPKERQDSHVVQVIEQGLTAVKTFGKAILLLDRHFLSVPALKRWKEGNQSTDISMHLVTQAKANAVAYEPPEKKKGKGRPRKKGAMVKLRELFQTRASEFETTTVTMYGKEETVQYLCLDLLWGQGLYLKLRFVLVRWGDRLSILVSTDLTLAATDIIALYGYRFKIECMFREMKQAIGAFCYRFWSKSMPKLNRYLKKGAPHPVEQVTDEKERTQIQLTVKAIEGYVMCCCIAMGLLQLIAIRYSTGKLNLFFRYLRTPSKKVVSEATVMAYLRTSIFRLFARNSHLTITQIIQSKQEMPGVDTDSLVS